MQNSCFLGLKCKNNPRQFPIEVPLIYLFLDIFGGAKNSMKHKKQDKAVKTAKNGLASNAEVFLIHLISALGLAAAFGVAHNVYSISFVSNPSHFLFLIWVIECPIVILLFSRYRQNPKQCSYLKAVGRGILGLPVGALVNALAAIALGAPVGFRHLPNTINWSLMMSSFTVVPAASVFGSSWIDWQRIFAETKLIGKINILISLPSHGALIGGWFGAWLMPLDWERPWQEWPICVSYGAIAGYLIAMVASFVFVLVRDVPQHAKGE